MKILLVNPPCRIPTLVPLGLGYIASILRQGGHDVALIDLNAQKRPLSSVGKELEGSAFGLIGIGGLTTTYDFVKNFSAIAKKAEPAAKVIAGNMVSTAHPELLLKNSDVDICVIDEGEETVRELVYRLENLSDLDGVKGIAFKKNGRIVRTAPRERIKDIDQLPYPAWDLFPMETYINHPIYDAYGKRCSNVSTVRGCPFQCIYCSRPFGSRVYQRSGPSVLSEMKELKRRYKITYISFCDDLFTVNRPWIIDFCDILMKEKTGISWGTSARVNLVDADLLKKMKKAGCESLSYGFESGSQKILDNMKKGARVEQAERAIEATRKSGIRVNGSFMISMLGETEETVSETIQFIKRTGLALDRFFYTTPYPGTPLYEIARSMGRIPSDEDAYLSSLGEMCNTLAVNLTDMPDDKLKTLKEDAEKRVKQNFGIITRLRLLSSELRRIYENFKKRLSRDGIPAAIIWAVKKTGKRLMR